MTTIIDLSKFKAICGKLDTEPFELLLVTNFQLVVDINVNTIEIVNRKIANKLFNNSDEQDIGYKEILVFYKEKSYLTHIIKYYSILQHMILKEVSPYVKNIKYKRTVSEDPYMIEFEVMI